MNIKRLKTCVLLSMMMPLLSSCSSDNIDNYIKKDYKIIKAYEMNSEDNDDFYLIKIDKNILNSVKVIGKFNTIEEAKEYLNIIISNKEKEVTDNLILSGLSIIIVGGYAYYWIMSNKKDMEKDKIKILKK